MAPYYPLTVARSDGEPTVPTKQGVKEPNQPTEEQMSDKPDVAGNVDCYKKLGIEDAKHIDWRRKLGGMMMHLLGGKAHADRNYILAELPEGYVLWEHLKYNVNNVDDEKRIKGKHAAGVYDRQDAYLYGHPQGRKRRFRSPADFFPHLLWLATDMQEDANNCSCKICSPAGDDYVDESTKTQDDGAKAWVQPIVKGEHKPTPPPVPVPIVPKSLPLKPIPSHTMPWPPGRSAEQTMDAEPGGPFIYRPGELVWFNRGHAWGLSVIVKRQAVANGKAQYLVQPLSNPNNYPSAKVKEQEGLRPWLAWTVPEATITGIRERKLTFETVDWEKVNRGEYGKGDPEVDGSILAARAIDVSYSLYDKVDNPTPIPGETHYHGMFLGAEKIWCGEPIRLETAKKEDIFILVVHKLIERTSPPSTSIVTFVGDVYEFVSMPTPYNNRSEWPSPNLALPPRVNADILFRNQVADNAKRPTWCEWRLVEANAHKGLKDIKGRWYETRTLLPILKGEPDFHLDVQQGITSDTGMWMNGRGDTCKGEGQRKKNRKVTLGQAVPQDCKISRGLDGPAADNIFPTSGAAAAPLQAQPQAQSQQTTQQYSTATTGQGAFYG